MNQAALRWPQRARESDSVSRVSEIADQLPTDIEALQALAGGGAAPSGTPRSPSATQALSQNRSPARISCASCSARSSAAARRSSIPSSSLWRSRTSSRPSPASEAADDKKDPAAARGARRQAPRQSRRASRPSAARHVTIEPEDTNCPCCRAPMHVIGEETLAAARRGPGAVPGDRDAPSQICLPGLRGGGGSGAGARAADQGRAADRGDGRLTCWSPNTPGICRSIGRPRCCSRRASTSSARSLAFWVGYAAAELRPLYAAAARTHPDLRQDRGRRDDGAGARSRPRPHQEGILLGDRARRPAVGRDRPAGRRLHLRARSRRRCTR